MAGERTGRTALQRSRLSNITNVVNGGSWYKENELFKSIYSSSECQLQQEIKKLEQVTVEKDLVIAEKDREIASQKLFMHKMQRDFYTNICKRAQQNEEVIGFNTRLSKELSNVREQLKMLQHEYTQMTVVYKINESELQTRLAVMQDELNRLKEEKEKASYDLMDPDENTISSTRRTGSARRHSPIGDICNPSTTTFTSLLDHTTVTTSRGRQRQRGVAQTSKDTLKLKIRQNECASTPNLAPYVSGPVAASSTKQYNNRYGHLNNLEPMQELVEESEPHTSCSTSSHRSRGNPFLDPLSMEVMKREITDQSCNDDAQSGEVVSTTERNAAGVTKSTEPRLAMREYKNLCDKSPPPTRPITPLRRAPASHPSTPHKRTDTHMTSQKKAASPGNTTPIRNADALQASKFTTSRAQASSPFRNTKPEQSQSQPSTRVSPGGRPSRRAAETVISYKEPSLVSKMRRPH